MDIWYRKDTGLEYLFSRMQSKESHIKVAPITDPTVSGDDPTMPSKPLGGEAVWGGITGVIEDQKDLITKLEELKVTIEQELVGDVSSIFIYCGQVPTFKDLPKDAKVGHVYDIKENGSNYVWNGTTWDKLSETVDLSNYVTITGLDSKLDLYYLKTEVDDLLKQLVSKEDLKQELDAPQGTQFVNLKDYPTTGGKLVAIDDNMSVNAQKWTQTEQKFTLNDEKLQQHDNKFTQNDEKFAQHDQKFVETDAKFVTAKQEMTNFQDTVNASLDTQDGNIQTLVLRMQELEGKLIDVKSLDPEILVLYDGSDTNFENREKDFFLSGTIAAPTTVRGHNVDLKDTTITSASACLTAAQDVTVITTTSTGIMPQKIADALIQIHCDGYVAVRDSNFNQESAYNGVEIGLTYGLAKSVVIENVDFAGHLDNNGINIYSMARDGVITIANCHFGDLKNVIMLSNRINVPYTLNIINCKCDKWATGEFAGMLRLEDNTSGSIEEANTNDQFSKITINIQNLVKPDGTKLQKTDLKNICGTKDDNQIIYMWDKWRGHTPYGVKYPTINIL